MGLRVLIVEDEAIIAFSLEASLQDFGHQIAGIAGRLQNAMELAKNLEFDVAIVDLKLHDELSLPLADMLVEMGRPFVFTTGYGETELVASYAKPMLAKPYDEKELMERLRQVMFEAGKHPEDGPVSG